MALPQFQVGEEVWVKHDNFQTNRPSKKLDHKWFGPYTVLAKVNDSAYKLDLPESMRVHLVFNIDKLSKFKPSSIEGQDFE